jgi:hypothetical protein
MEITRGNILANIIRIAGNISSVAVDGIDGYAKDAQIIELISKYLEDIKLKLAMLREV